MALRYLAGVVTLELETAKCNGCGLCIRVCPHGVFEAEDHKVRIADRDACMECGACAMNCKPGAVVVRSGVGCAYAVLLERLRGRVALASAPGGVRAEG